MKATDDLVRPFVPSLHMTTFHPGEFVLEEMEARGWGIETLAEKSLLKRDLLEEVLAGHRKVTPLVALGLSYAFGTGREIWLNLQRSWDERGNADV